MHKEELESKIKEAQGGQFIPPAPNANLIAGWWKEDKEVLEAITKDSLLELDLEIERKMVCRLKCIFCFEDAECPKRQTTKEAIRWITGILEEAKPLGLVNIKIVGPGEPLLFPGLLDVVEHCFALGVVPVIFTAGDVLGDDQQAKTIFGHKGINSGQELANRLFELGASLIIKFLTFAPNVESRLVGNKPWYMPARDKGLINAVRAGFCSYKPTRLGVDCLLLKSNFKEATDLLSFFNRFNIFCVLNSSMNCGSTEESRSNPEVLTMDESLEAATVLYRFCLENKIPFKGISPYFTAGVCQQLKYAEFIRANGEIRLCPGGPKIGTYHPGNLADQWQNSRSVRDHFREKDPDCKGCSCISRIGKTLYTNFEERVRNRLGL